MIREHIFNFEPTLDVAEGKRRISEGGTLKLYTCKSCLESCMSCRYF